MKNFIIAIAFLFTFTNCDNDSYATGESVGKIETISQIGHFNKTFEVVLFINVSSRLMFSFDGDKDNSEMIEFAKKCQETETLIRIFWHEEINVSQNWRGETNMFIDSLKIINKP